MSFKLYTFSKLLLLIISCVLLSVKCTSVPPNAAFLAPTSAGESNNQFVQRQPTNFFHTAESSSLNRAALGYPNIAHYQRGYNYQTPASTYGSYSTAVTETHKSQTPPLAVSLHSDDYENFDKTAQTFFVPRNKKLLSHITQSVGKSEDEFYVSRENSLPKKQWETTKIDSEQFPSNFKASLPAERQQMWKPLAAVQDSLDQPHLAVEAVRNSVHVQQNGDFISPRTVTNNKAVLGDISSFRSQLTRTNTNPNEAKLNSTGNISKLQTETRATCCSNQAESLQIAQAGEALSIATISGHDQRAPMSLLQDEYSSEYNGIYLTDTQRQQRVQILKSLLAEYLALTLPEAPQKISSNLNYDVGRSAAEKSYTESASGHSIRSSAHIDSDISHYQRLPRYRNSISNPVRRPHSFYGAPFAEIFNSNADSSQNPQQV